ncbi:hypothetical protein BLNAU_4760 [Blattamonas nauphoetae]|uniref:Uncharacterized protein n=1 Tax=Blattamonas nauphoetae TaxID=2049346 RepID=A0ABQ9Y8W6_9EUKA|nr:hypothetical protein BLNAU_4760 [Blattamonas nauphoetae]
MQFCSRMLESGLMMMQLTLSPPRTTQPTVTTHHPPPSTANTVGESASEHLGHTEEGECVSACGGSLSVQQPF